MLLLETIAKKTEANDQLRCKFNRHDFAIKEAILFLSKPLQEYMVWIDNGDESNNNQLPDISNKIRSRTNSQSPTFQAQLQKDKGGLEAKISSNDIPIFESIRIAVKYLKNALDNSENPIQEKLVEAIQQETPKRIISTSLIKHVPKRNIPKGIEEEDESGDIALCKNDDQKPLNLTPGPTKFACRNCNELTLTVEDLEEQIHLIKRDMQMLACTYEQEKTKSERIQLSKDLLDSELEELTAQLFDQANKLVIEEATLREKVEDELRRLKENTPS